MNTYILLRNNKESSSLTLDGLRQEGLKATDLVWVECQSVCWQHPHEIAELKSLVAGTINRPVMPVQSLPVEISTDFSEIIPEKTAEKKLVYVELPAAVNSSQKQTPVNSVSGSGVSDLHKYGGVATEEELPVEKKQDDISIKYSRPLDEIKEMYVKNLHNKSQKNSINIKLPKQFKKIALYAGLLIAGATLMLLINNIGRKKSPVTAENSPQKIQNNEAKTVVPGPVETDVAQQPADEQNNLPIEQASSSTEEKKTPVTITKPTATEKENENIVTQDITKGKVEKKIPDVKEIPETKPVAVENISSKLSLNTNDYVVGSFGGIRNLEITLHNDSKYLLDKVTAELQYLNPEGIILKSENIYFQSVPAGEVATVPVKKTKRGVKITYRITKIESKEISSGTAGL